MVGDIVLAPMPFTDLRDLKFRPVVILADVGMDDWIVCQITSSPQRRLRSVDISTEDMLEGRLPQSSVVRPDRLFTLNEDVFRTTVGRLTNSKLAEITDAVRNLF